MNLAPRLSSGLTVPSTASIMAASAAAAADLRLREDLARPPAFRAGSQGLFVDQSTVTGNCHRAAWARYAGAEEPARVGDSRDATKSLMFAAGTGNEDLIADDLAAWVTGGGRLLREEEIPIAVEVDGVPLTGRPDIVLADAAGKPLRGLELKLAASIGTAIEVLYHGPKLAHLAQAGRYDLGLRAQLGLSPTDPSFTYELLYVNRVVLPIPAWGFLTSRIPEQGAPGAEWVEFSAGGKPTKCPPFLKAYELRWAPDADAAGLMRLHARALDAASATTAAGRTTEVPWLWTLVTAEGLEDFWRMTRDVGDGHLGPRVTELGFDGSESFDKCAYCGWAPTCDRLESRPAEWLAEVRRVAAARRASAAPPTTGTSSAYRKPVTGGAS